VRKLIYYMTVSLDGFIAGPDGEIDWSAPTDELHRFHNQQVQALGGHLLGRRLYEEMLFWERWEDEPSAAEHEREFARIWKRLPKVVFSNTLDSVEGNTTLADGDPVEVAAELKRQPGEDLAVGGAGLASTLIRAGLVDEYHQFVIPVVLGAGTPYFPPLEERIELDLVETRTFGRTVYLHLRAGA
jgi:dihydrofolate reductase